MSEGPLETTTVETRRLAAIMFTDIAGFSRQMGADEARTLRLLAVHNQVVEQAIVAHHGHIIKTFGDAFLVDFPSVVHAVQCAQRIQAQFRAHNAEQDKANQIHIRIGVHLGDIVVQPNGDVLGDGVNIASRLQTLAEPDTICISQKVYEEVEKKLALGAVVSLGRPKLKNIAPRFPVYALLSEQPQGLRQTLRIQRLKLSRRVGPVVLVFVSVLLLGGIVIFLYPSLPTLITHHSSLITQEAQPPSLPLPDKPSIVVLPFDNMSKDPDQDYFSDGLTEALTGDLSKISSLFVIARNSAFTYKGKAVKVQDVGREMGVRYVLEGSVLKAEGQVRITAQLIDATTGYHLWSERYDRPLHDIFALQDEITQKIVAALEVKLTEDEQAQLWRQYTPTNSLEAYDYFLRALAYARIYTPEANAQAQQMLRKALELDPKFTAAYALLSARYYVAWISQWSQDPQTLEQAFALAQRAISLNDAIPNAHRALAMVYLFKKQYETALAEAQRAIGLDPNFAESYVVLAAILNSVGRSGEAVGSMEKAMRLDPHHPAEYIAFLGQAYRLTGRTEAALTMQKRALSRNPNFLLAHLELALIYAESGRQEEARAEAAEVLRINPKFSLEVHKERVPIKDPAVLERHLAALHKAGLK